MPKNKKKKNDDSNNDSSENDSENTGVEVEINEDACEKYGISLSEPATEPVEPYSRYNPDDTVYGFVTEVSHDSKGTEIEIKDWGYCLEENRIELGFQNMPRSQIMEEVIKTYGLIPVVDLTDLNDDVISWNNQVSHASSSKTNTGGGGNLTANGDGSMTWEQCWEIAESWSYGGNGSGHDPELAWKNMGTKKNINADCYDATAWLYYVLNFKVGVPARDIVGGGNAGSGTHHVIQVNKNGKWQFPEEYHSMTTNLRVTEAMYGGDFKVSREPPNGKNIPEYRNDWYGDRS